MATIPAVAPAAAARIAHPPASRRALRNGPATSTTAISSGTRRPTSTTRSPRVPTSNWRLSPARRRLRAPCKSWLRRGVRFSSWTTFGKTPNAMPARLAQRHKTGETRGCRSTRTVRRRSRPATPRRSGTATGADAPRGHIEYDENAPRTSAPTVQRVQYVQPSMPVVQPRAMGTQSHTAGLSFDR